MGRAHANGIFLLPILFLIKNTARVFSVVLNGEIESTERRQRLFSLPICVIIKLTKKPLPLGEVAAKPTERAKWSENH